MRAQVGQRIGAVRNADRDTAYLFGFGTYQGDEIPPEDVRGPFGARLGLLGIPNPKLVMDDGSVVWGCESWWGDETKVMQMVGKRRIEFVKPPERIPPTAEERAEAEQAMRSAQEKAQQLVDDLKALKEGE